MSAHPAPPRPPSRRRAKWIRSPKWKYILVGMFIGLPALGLCVFSLMAVRGLEAESTQEFERRLEHLGSQVESEFKAVRQTIENAQEKAEEALTGRVQSPLQEETRTVMEELRRWHRWSRDAWLVDRRGRLLYPMAEEGTPNAGSGEYRDQLVEVRLSRDPEAMWFFYQQVRRDRWKFSPSTYETFTAQLTESFEAMLLGLSPAQQQAPRDRWTRAIEEDRREVRRIRRILDWTRAKRSMWKSLADGPRGLTFVVERQPFEERLRGQDADRVLVASAITRGEEAQGFLLVELDWKAVQARLMEGVAALVKQPKCAAALIASDGREIGRAGPEAAITSWPTWAVRTVELEAFPDLVREVRLAYTDPLALSAQARQGVRVLAGVIVLMVVVLAVSLLWTIRLVSAELQVARLTTNFVSNVSHELKTPLSVILLATEKLSLGRFRNQGEVQEYYRLMLSEGQRLKRLIENVLDFSKMSEGKKSFRFALQDLAQLSREAVQNIRPRAETEGFAVSCSSDPDLPPVLADRDAITQAVLNLLDNAMKYSKDHKEIHVHITRNEGRVAVAVQDRGLGIAEADLARVFEKFYQAGDALTTEVKGVGLGLAIVKYIVDAHGGEVRVASRMGDGSTFTLLLPAAPAPEPSGSAHAA